MAHSPAETANQKQNLREEMRRCRAQLAAEVRAAESEAACAHLRAGWQLFAGVAVFVYQPRGTELNIAAALPQLGAARLLCSASDMLRWAPENFAAINFGDAGLQAAPLAAHDWVVFEARRFGAVLAPGLAFDRGGGRLGYGGGYFDRLLARLRHPNLLIIGCCFEEQIVEQVPIEPHDFRMTHLLTPRGLCPVSDA